MHLSFFQDILKQPWSTNMLPGYSMPGEQSSRMMSMQMAEKNIYERLQQLSAHFRQQRQDAITDELLDIVAGIEMVKDEV